MKRAMRQSRGGGDQSVHQEQSDDVECQYHAQTFGEGIENLYYECKNRAGEADTDAGDIRGGDKDGESEDKRNKPFEIFARGEHRVGNSKEKIEIENR